MPTSASDTCCEYEVPFMLMGFCSRVAALAKWRQLAVRRQAATQAKFALLTIMTPNDSPGFGTCNKHSRAVSLDGKKL